MGATPTIQVIGTEVQPPADDGGTSLPTAGDGVRFLRDQPDWIIMLAFAGVAIGLLGVAAGLGRRDAP